MKRFASLAALFLAGCGANLVPAPSAEQVAGLDEAARSRVEGVQVVAQVDEWPGALPIEEEVTPVRIIVENNSGKPLRFSYDQFALVSPDGRRFSALPPLRIEGAVSRAITAPGFGYRGFELAPGYGPYYPGMTAFRGSYYTNPYYYNAYSPYWAEVELPTEEMVQRAIPEGVLQNGGRVDGYLYFEKVSDEVPAVTFRADLVNAQNGATFGEIRIPFVVE